MMDSITSSIETAAEGSFHVAHIHLAELQKKNEDRTAVIHFERHCGSELATYAAETLPVLLAKRLGNRLDVEVVLKETIEEFDRSLLLPVLELFKEDEDWSDESWLDFDQEVLPVIGCDQEDESFRLGRRAAAGCTALLAFLDQARTNLWVASLGDCDAVCMRREDPKLTPIFLSERHNCSNPAELVRMHAEHPNEEHAVVYDAVLGCLRVTRALGDHQLKVPLLMASRVMPYFHPSLLNPDDFETFPKYTPPYISSTPEIRCHSIAPGDLFLFASDGLRDMLTVPDADKFPILISLVRGESDARLGHECVEARDGDNLATRVIQNLLFGVDPKAKQLIHPNDRDDISLVVLRIE
ncbi:phosphatase 2C-like domain-containing protein [Mycena galericulata]|nr:phosphatase 2C-like domain-containing protein [Mycena galericulata]